MSLPLLQQENRMPKSPYNEYDPFDLLEQLASQNKSLHQQLAMIISNQHALAAALNDQQTQLSQLKKRIEELTLEVYYEENSRPFRRP
jgi:TolA-binding protein